MPEYLHPGVYVQEESSGSKPIEGASTSTACFVGTAPRGQPNRPIFVTSWASYERAFGGLDKKHPMPLAIRHFFENGGKRAYILRVLKAPPPPPAPGAPPPAAGGAATSKASVTIAELLDPVSIEAAGAGVWGDSLRVNVRYSQFSRNSGPAPANPKDQRPILYDWLVEMKNGSGIWETIETFKELGALENGDKFYASLINRDSQVIRIVPGTGGFPELKPGAAPTKADDKVIPWDPTKAVELDQGNDGGDPNAADFQASLKALDRVDDASILVIPGAPEDVAMVGASYVEAQRPLGDMIYIVDSLKPEHGESGETQTNNVKAFVQRFSPKTSYAALYFPWVEVPDPYSKVSGAKRLAPPSGMIAGLYARTDNTRGVWKAPAGTEATLAGAVGVSAQVTDGDQDALNPIGVNCVRQFPSSGIVVWGARTLSTQSNPEYRYVPVRRTAMFLKTSLYRGTQWVVFEPNDEPLWSSIRFNLNAFMLSLFRQSAFQGGKPAEAYLVKCDADNNIQATIDAGQVHIMVGFAPLKPAEFVIIHLQQLRKE